MMIKIKMTSLENCRIIRIQNNIKLFKKDFRIEYLRELQIDDGKQQNQILNINNK